MAYQADTRGIVVIVDAVGADVV